MPDDDLSIFHDYLANLKETVDNVLGEQVEQKAQSSLDVIIRSALRDILIELGMAAIASLDEFRNDDLQELFRDMLSHSSHVAVHGGHVDTAFNEAVAGDFYDLIHASPKQHTMTESAPAFWKYGIYLPGHDGVMPSSKAMLKAMEKLPTYEDIIQERVGFWRSRRDIAPFWMIIDKGTTSFADAERAYPQVPGTNFVDQFRAVAPRVAERAKYVYMANVAESLGAEVEYITGEPRKGGRMVIARIPVTDGSVSVLSSSAGNIFFQIGRRGLSFEEAKSLVKRAYK